jgi:putative glutamine amidotransferase
MRPIIGIPCYVATRAGSDISLYANNASYVDAVEQAGGIPLLIPPLADDESLATIYARLDGLLLSGGGDVDPAHYGQERLPTCQEPESARDLVELALARRAVAAQLPILGICRGQQLLNVALGGTLYQDLATERPEASQHDRHDRERDYRAHEIAIAPSSRLGEILGTTSHPVNSLHHQAVHQLGEGMRIVAQAEDGVVEAVELDGHPFALAVQFHPEELVASDEPSRRLFAAFVTACQKR